MMDEIFKRGLETVRNTILFEKRRKSDLEDKIETAEYQLAELKQSRDFCLHIIAENEALLKRYEKEQSK